MFHIRRLLGREKKKIHDEDEDIPLPVPSLPHTRTPRASSPSSVTTTVADGGRASEPSVANTRRPPQLERLTSELRAFSFGRSERSRSRSSDRREDPLGLTVVHEPSTVPLCDIVFVHGLGGTSRATWAKERDLRYFWPQMWLPYEPGIGDARILSFGYNANFAATGPAPITGIADFAKDLLHSMKYAKNEDLEELELGQRPIIFIAHSMGGLVVKQAYTIGKGDPLFFGMISSISAMVFLATPHRGSNLADILNRLLAASIFRHSPKMYISELEIGSQTIEALNDQFRHFAPSLRLFSFYETLPTAVGPKKMIIVDKGSATTGYPNEISKSLNADHHTVCKFDGNQDSDYVSVRNVLKTLIIEICPKGPNQSPEETLPLAEELEGLLGMCENYHDDLEFFKRLPQFRHALKDMGASNKSLEKADPKTIWNKIFVDILFKLRLPTTLYWVIDAVDESDYPQLLVELMQTVAKSSASVKILLVSRQNDDLTSTFDRLSVVVPSVYLPFEDTKKDIQTCVQGEVQYMRAPQEFKSMVIEKLVAGAEGNFLWASLALVEVMRCNTREDLDQILETIPSGMEQLYKRMEDNIIKKTEDRPQDRRLGHTILTWATCSRKALKLTELAQALQPEFSVVVDVQFTISRVCSQFVVVDASNRLLMVHQTARDHIMTTNSVLAINATEGHEKIFTKCLSVIEGQFHRRGSDHQSGGQELVDYAVRSWAYHFNLTSIESDEPLLQLAKFLKGKFVLAWIAALAQHNQLKVLAYSSKTMTLYVRRKRGRYRSTNPLLHRLQELDLVESWATDFLKILGKFGQILLASPSSIYQQIPPFCPKGSTIYRHFEQQPPSPFPLYIGGITQNVWDDGLARISLGPKTQTQSVICSGPCFAVLTGAGGIYLYDSTTFDFLRLLSHAERVCAMTFSGCSNLLATYGFRTTKVWSVKTGNVMYEIRNPLGSRAFTITFAADNLKLVIGSNDRLIRVAQLTLTTPMWSTLHPGLLKEDTTIGRQVHNMPWRIAFNFTASCVAVAYRGAPLCVWSLDPPEMISRCMRNQEYAGNGWTVVDQMIWHPQSEEIVGLYLGGHVFRWNPWDETQQELQAHGSIIALSPDGKFFAVGNSNGTIKLYDFQHFALIYQLSCKSLINDICFSPDSKRLYDLRGQFCNVWGPNALIRADESVDHESDVVSDAASVPTLAASEAVAEVRDQVTALGVQITGRYHAIGNEAGAISLIDSTESDHHPFQLCESKVPLSITHLDWSSDGKVLAIAELTGKVVVKKVQIDGRRGSTTTLFDVKPETSPEGSRRVFLNKDGNRLLVKSGPTVTMWSLSPGTNSQNAGISIQSPDSEWFRHPEDSALLLAFNPSYVRLHRWDDLSEVGAFDIPPVSPCSNAHSSRMTDRTDVPDRVAKIGRIYSNASGSHLLIDVVKATDTSQRHSVSILPTAALKPSSGGNSLSPSHIPAAIQSQIEIPLGLLPKQRMIFLDRDYWMCSWRVGANPASEKIQRYYCLPKDWLNGDCLKLSALLADGRFLIPNNGELGVIKCAAMSLW
ncbi:hypothetical protein G7Y79_00039g075910 [Physcia stellaris]|nr:hypothetical protein G7Y79_00039g075910 [Physcia stellaris]